MMPNIGRLAPMELPVDGRGVPSRVVAGAGRAGGVEDKASLRDVVCVPADVAFDTSNATSRGESLGTLCRQKAYPRAATDREAASILNTSYVIQQRDR